MTQDDGHDASILVDDRTRSSRRLEFAGVPAHVFASRLEHWRLRVSATGNLPRIAHRVANYLPKHLNRAEGRLFPSDDLIARELGCSTRHVRKAMTTLEAAGFIQRETRVRAGKDGRRFGKSRKIYLSLPSDAVEHVQEPPGKTPSLLDPETRERSADRITSETKMHSDRNGLIPTDRSDPFPITSDQKTSDQKIRSGVEESSVHSRASQSGGNCPLIRSYEADEPFLSEFDRQVADMLREHEMGAFDLERLTQQAFDSATLSNSEHFMPFLWTNVRSSTTNEFSAWFRQRASWIVRRQGATRRDFAPFRSKTGHEHPKKSAS